ncbi:MAG TPA: TonB-dependent receptor plug domain-containing protein [Gemmatimonadales bacterium]|nr:TonB-dependent receptor plug domain-containing protein [Gemmatimonadales bacterium]
MRTSARILIVFVFASTITRQRAAAQDSLLEHPPDSIKLHLLQPVTVIGRSDDLIGSAATASEGHVGAIDLRLRPLLREGELQEAVPGMIVTQHSGDGKANQYFVRGFNLDHGTDFQTTLEGMPLNMPTNAHGQGYTDLNFLIPELVDYLDYRLGVYYADVGDFGSAGAVEYHLVRSLDQPIVTSTAGENGMARLAAAGSLRVRQGALLVGGEVKGYNGPWETPERLRKLSGLARYSWGAGPSQFSVLATAYHNSWNASDQIPLRAVESGAISRFGEIDSTDGGTTERYSVSGSWRHVGATAVRDVQLYGIRSTLSLFSNFEYALTDTIRGDQFNQSESRIVLGGQATQRQEVQALSGLHLVTVGVQARYDGLSPVGLYHTQARLRLNTVREDDVHELGSGVFVAADSRWTARLRTAVGLRGDLYAFDVASDLPANSGRRTAGILSPKLSIAFAPSAATELYVSGGLGFHSNDARGTTTTIDPGSRDPVRPVDPLVRSRGAEVGGRFSLARGYRSTLTLWLLNLDSELLFSGDGGTTEPSAASQRRGVTWANFCRPIPQLLIDADLSFARARFVGVSTGADHIPGALENVVAAGVTWSPLERGAYGSIRLRHFGSYPLTEDDRVRATPTNLVNAEAGYFIGRVRLQVSVLNLFNAVADDIEYYYTSRLPGEPAGGVDDIHFHPVEPRQLRVSLEWGL